jgi:RNA recognition motif-containing protein
MCFVENCDRRSHITDSPQFLTYQLTYSFFLILGALMNIFVGNLAKDVTDDDLMQEFSAYGKVKSVKVIRDLFSGESKGFGFVEMDIKSEAETAIKELNTKDVKGKKLNVNEARPKTDNRRPGGRGGNSGGHRGGNGGGGGRSFGRR